MKKSGGHLPSHQSSRGASGRLHWDALLLVISANLAFVVGTLLYHDQCVSVGDPHTMAAKPMRHGEQKNATRGDIIDVPGYDVVAHVYAPDDNALVVTFNRRDSGEAVMFDEVLRQWRIKSEIGAAARTLVMSVLKKIGFAAYHWETPPVTSATVSKRAFEMRLLRSDALAAMKPQPRAFEAHFRNTTENVLSFSNLGGDAVLIVPRVRVLGIKGDVQQHVLMYPHLGAFMRAAPLSDQHALWAKVGSTMLKRIASMDDKPVWLSTAGLGVGWLHVRLDSRPKYYRSKLYKRPPASE